MVLLLHGGVADELLIEIVLPVVMFIGLYKWADRKSKRENAANRSGTAAPETADAPSEPAADEPK
jgi:hypothetical protein